MNPIRCAASPYTAKAGRLFQSEGIQGKFFPARSSVSVTVEASQTTWTMNDEARFFPYPDYLGYIWHAVTELPEYYQNEPSEGTVNEFRRYARITVGEVGTVIAASLLWTALRSLMTAFLFKPLGRLLQLTAKNQKKMPECAWRFVFHILSWSFIAYVLLVNHPDILRDPPLGFIDWSPDMVIPRDIKMAYVIEGGYYIHALAAVLFLDVWRSDSWVMCVHHILTLALITLSYALRYHYIGLMVVLYHDVSDIFLDVSKCNMYLRDRAGVKYMLHEYLANASFAAFTITWCAARMYLFPMKVLYNILPSTGKTYTRDHLPFGIEFNLMLILLMMLDIYWFGFIILFIYKLVTRQLSELDDIREREESKDAPEDENRPVKSETNGFTNGATCNGVSTEANGSVNGNGLKHRHLINGS